MADNSQIRYLNPIDIEVKKSKYCRFKKSGIKFIDYKDPDFLMKFEMQTEPRLCTLNPFYLIQLIKIKP